MGWSPSKTSRADGVITIEHLLYVSMVIASAPETGEVDLAELR